MSDSNRPSQEFAGPPGLFGTLWRVTLTGVFCFLLAGAAGYAAVWYLVKTPETQAPDLLALKLEEALATASQDGFSVRVAEREPSDLFDPGIIVAQRPMPGTWIKEGATIQLTVAE